MRGKKELTGVQASDSLILTLRGVPLRGDRRDGTASFARHLEVADKQKSEGGWIREYLYFEAPYQKKASLPAPAL